MKQEVWYWPDMDQLILVESRGRSYVVCYVAEDCFMAADVATGAIVERKEFKSPKRRFFKVGIL